MTKRILALFMSLCMIFSMVPVLGAAASGTEAEFTLSHAAWRTSDCLIYLNLDAADVSESTVASGTGVDAIVDGTEMKLWAYPVSASQVFMVVGVSNGEHMVELKAGTAVGSYTVKSDVIIKLTSAGGTQLESVRLGIDTTKGSFAGMNTDNGTGRYVFFLSGISGYDNWNEAQTLVINETEHTYPGSSGNYEYNGAAFGSQVLMVYYNFLTEGAAAADQVAETTISIPAGSVFGNYITENTLKFTVNGYSLTVHPTEVSIEEVTGGYNGQYIFYMNTDIAYTVDAVHAVKLLVNGTEQTVWMNTGDQTFISCDSAVAFGENEITIPAGTQLGDCVVAEDYTFYTHEDGGIDTTPGIKYTDIVSVSGGNNGQYIIYLHVDTAYTLSADQALTVLVNGTEQTVWLIPDNTPFIAGGAEIPMGENTVVIPAGSQLGDRVLKNAFTFYTHSDGGVDTVAPKYMQITSADGGYNGQYIINLYTDSAYTLTTAQAVTIQVNGEAKSVWLNPAETPFISGGTEIPMGENTIVIPAGTKLGDSYLTTDFVCYTHADGSVDTVKPIKYLNVSSVTGGYNNQYILYVNTDVAYTVNAVHAVKLLVNGTEQTVWMNTGDQPFISCESTIAFGENEIVIPAGTQLGDGVVAEDYTFYTHADGGIDTVKPIKYLNISSVTGGYNNQYIFYVDTDVAYTVDAVHAVKLLVNGTEQTVWMNTGDQPFISCESTIAFGENEIVIPAGTQLGDGVVAEDYTFYTHEDGSIDTFKPIQYVNITDVVSGAYRTNDWYIVLQTNVPEFTLGAVSGLQAVVDETTGQIWFQTNDSLAVEAGKLALTLEISLDEHKVTIPAGTVLGDYVLENDFVFYTHDEGVVDMVEPSANPVSVVGLNTAISKHNGTSYHIYLNMSDSAFELDSAYNNTTIDVLVDGETKAVFLFSNGAGSLLIDGWDRISLGKHTVTIPAGTVIGDYVLENAYSFRTYSGGMVGEVDRGEITLDNATAMMGGSYGDGLYYDLTGSFAGANWIVNAAPAEGNITMEYVKLSEDKDSAYYGPVRLVRLDDQYPNTFGVVLNTASTTFANEWGLTNVAWAYHADEHAAYFCNGAGNMQLVPTDYGYVTAWNSFMTDDLLSSQDFVGIDGKGAQYFGIGWGACAAHTVNWTKLMIYDAQGNDLGVTWFAGEGVNATLTPMVEYGATVYLKAADNNGLKVTGWKVIDLEGNQIAVEATEGENGVWSFVVPEDAMSIEPVYSSVDLTIMDNNGNVLVQNNIYWLNENIQLAAKQVEESVPAGYVLMGYQYGDSLYAALENIPVTEDMTALEVTAVTLQFKVQEQAEIRHGDSLADSGLRFVATLGQTEFIPKVLLISESVETLSVADAQWKVGNPYHTEENPFIEIISLDGTISYSIVLINIPAADYSKTYYARAGILVSYADIGEDYIYTDVVASTVNEAAQNTLIITDPRTEYVDGVMNLDADANLVGSHGYSVAVSNNADGDYVITYDGSNVRVTALTIDGQRFTTDDGVVFGDGTVTVPSGLFANAKLQKELTNTGSMDVGAYFGPSVGLYQYTESSGTVTNKSVKRTHDQVYADVEDYFNAGFNIWMAEDWVYGGTQYSENDAFSALDLAAEYCINHGLTGEDIQVLVTDTFLNGLLDGTDMNNGDRNEVSQYAAIAESRINALINYIPVVDGVAVGAEYNCFAGYLLRDEPQYKHMKYYAPWFSFLAADESETANVIAWNTSGEEVSGSVSCMGLLSKGYTLYFSLLGMSSGKNVITSSTSEAVCSEAEYLAYLSQFVDNVNASVWNYDNMVLAFDNYGLYSEASSSFGSTAVNYTEALSDNWQQNMSLFADLVESKNGNAAFATALRSSGMARKWMASKWSSKNWTEYQAFDSGWGAQAISMQVYTALAHGYEYLNYYTYWEPHNQAYKGETYTDACVMWDANMNPVKQNMYYWVQSANAELRQLENLISNFSYVETAAVAAGDAFYTGTGNVGSSGMGGLWTASQLAENSALAGISATVDTTAGYFTKTSGEFKDMFILVNMSHPNEKVSDTVTMSFDAGYTAVIVYLDGVASIYQLSDGECIVTLPSGEGAIVIPVA